MIFTLILDSQTIEISKIDKNKKATILDDCLFVVGVAGFEPTTPCSQSRCANRTALHPEKPVDLRLVF